MSSKNSKKKSGNRKSETYYPEVIKPAIDENLLLKYRTKSEKFFQRERQHKEMQKQLRIGLERQDSRTHAVNLLISRAEEALSGKSRVDYGTCLILGVAHFSLHYYEFNFNDTLESSLLFEQLLNNLKDEKCILDWKINPYVQGYQTEYIFDGVCSEKLKRYLNRMKQIKNMEDISPYLGFIDNNFFLKRLDNTPALINFYPRKLGEDTKSLYLLKALVHLLVYGKTGNSCENGVARLIFLRDDVIKYLNGGLDLPTSTLTDNWFKYAKKALKDKIPFDYRELIELSDSDRATMLYTFTVKLPI